MTKDPQSSGKSSGKSSSKFQSEVLQGKRIAVLATDGFEQSELLKPVEALKKAGAIVEIIAPKSGSIRGWNKDDWGESVPVDREVTQVDASRYSALLLPGGVMSPDSLRKNDAAVNFAGSFFQSGKPVAAICHGPQLLIECGAVEGRQMTSYPSIRTDLANAGAKWVDREVVTDNGLTTSRSPDDLPAFCSAMVEQFASAQAVSSGG